MFGLKRRAQERAANDAAIKSAVYAKMTADLQNILRMTIGGQHGGGCTQAEAERFTRNAAEMQNGIDAVFLRDVDPYGPVLASEDRHTRAGAMLARAAWNMAALSGRLDNQQSYADLYRVLRLPCETDEILNNLRAKAAQGDATAQRELALASSRDTNKLEDAAPNWQEATKWWREIAMRGDIRAQFNLCYLYATGRWGDAGGPRDSDIERQKEHSARRNSAAKQGRQEAIKWLHTAADNGHAGAQVVLAQLTQMRADSLRLLPAEGSSWRFSEPLTDEGRAELSDAIKWYERAAGLGHLDAQMWLAGIYATTHYDVPDAVSCAKWLRKAAEAGHAGAQAKLGNMYATGDGVPQNLAEAARWYRSSAEQQTLSGGPVLGLGYIGVPESVLGYMYAVGLGVPQDFGEAARLFGTEAKRYRWHRDTELYLKGVNDGHFPLAFDAEAKDWLCGAAQRGWDLAQTAIKRLDEQSAKQAEEDRKLWRDRIEPPGFYGIDCLGQSADLVCELTAAADKGNADAHLLLGLIDTPSRLEWLQKAARNGAPLAGRLLGGMYAEGEGAARDHNLAEYWYRVAADLGDPVAQYELSRALLDVQVPSALRVKSGNRTTNLIEGARKLHELRTMIPAQKYIESTEWCSKAAAQGNAQAQCRLAIILSDRQAFSSAVESGDSNSYADGKYLPKDNQRAASLLRKSAEQGYANAQYELARFYAVGIGVAQDHREARHWYNRAAEQGHEEARYVLGYGKRGDSGSGSYILYYPVFDFDGGPLSQSGKEIVDWLSQESEAA